MFKKINEVIDYFKDYHANRHVTHGDLRKVTSVIDCFADRKDIEDYIKDNLTIHLNISEENDYGHKYDIVEVSLKLKDEEIDGDSITIER